MDTDALNKSIYSLAELNLPPLNLFNWWFTSPAMKPELAIERAMIERELGVEYERSN